MKRLVRKLIILKVLFLITPVIIWAEDVDLERIVVTSTRTMEFVKNTPNNITVVTRKEIDRSKAKTTLDVIREKAGVSVTEFSAGNGKLANVDIRGFGETGSSNTLVLVDGRRITQIDLSGTDWTQIPIDEVERIEIIRGAASVFYGDNATGGVINIITKEGEGEPKIEAKAEAGSYASYSSALEASGQVKDLAYYSLARYYDSAGYRNNNDITSRDFALKFGYRPSGMLNTKLNLGYHKDKYGLPNALSDDQINSPSIGRRGTVSPFDDAGTEDYFGDLMLEGDFQDAGKLTGNLSMRIRQAKANYMSSSPWESDSYIKTFGFTPKYILNKSLMNHNNKAIFGIDYYDTQDHIKSGPPNTENNVITISKKSYGIYFFDQLSLNDKLTGSFGYRYEKARYNFEQISAIANQKSSARSDIARVSTLGLNYAYDSNDSNIFLNLSQSFRFPLVDEIYSPGYPGYGGNKLNTTLDPQRGNNFDLGVRHCFTKNIRMGITFYRMDLHDEIYYNPYNYNNLNYDRTRHRGIENEFKARLWDKLNLFANYTFSDAYFYKGDFGGNKIPGVPVNKWAAGFDIDLLKGLNFSLIANYTGERYFLSDQGNNFPRMAAYTTLDLKLSYGKNNFSIYGGINNLSNEEYSEYGVIYSNAKYYYPSQKRNFIVGGSIKF